VLVGAVTVLVAASVRAWHPLRDSPRDLQVASCEGWRWPVKTLSDKRAGLVSMTSRRTTVAALRQLQPPAKLTARTLGVETTTYRLQARLVGIQLMQDGDSYLVIADPRTGGTMIAEFPMGWCANSASPAARQAMARASASLLRACRPTLGTYAPLGYRDAQRRRLLRQKGGSTRSRSERHRAPPGALLQQQRLPAHGSHLARSRRGHGPPGTSRRLAFAEALGLHSLPLLSTMR
jgi:hypothetical protein